MDWLEQRAKIDSWDMKEIFRNKGDNSIYIALGYATQARAAYEVAQMIEGLEAQAIGEIAASIELNADTNVSGLILNWSKLLRNVWLPKPYVEGQFFREVRGIIQMDEGNAFLGDPEGEMELYQKVVGINSPTEKLIRFTTDTSWVQDVKKYACALLQRTRLYLPYIEDDTYALPLEAMINQFEIEMQD